MRATDKQKGACQGFASAVVGFTAPCPSLAREGRHHRQHRRLTYASLRLQKKGNEETKEGGTFPQEAPPGSLFRPSSNALSRERADEPQRRIIVCASRMQLLRSKDQSERRIAFLPRIAITVISHCQQFTLARPRTVPRPCTSMSILDENYASRG